MAGYAHPEVLVSTEWVADNTGNAMVRLIEVNVDTMQYERGHIHGAIAWSWQSQLQDSVRRDLIGKAGFEALMSASGIAADTTVVVYGDNNNWFACWALWQLKYYGHLDVRVMNGGRRKWLEEERPLSTVTATYGQTKYTAGAPNEALRARRGDVFRQLEQGHPNLVDVRSPDEFSGRIIAPPGMPETAQRGGHIPGAVSVPWSKAANDDGTFRNADELRALYQDAGVKFDRPMVTYCRIGERSSHTWFVLRYLLGVEDVRNYDGSWTEWGNLIEAPIAKGA
jgi:thiosulfate/3-mercaptopyruvate sulfurtransferase